MIYYVINRKKDDEFTLAKETTLEEAIEAAREEWAHMCWNDRYDSDITVREYEEDIEAEDCTNFDYNTHPWQIWTACRENGDLIDQFESIAQAENMIESYEEDDKADGTYTPDFYDIVNEEHESIRR